MASEILILDFIGTFAFASYGSYFAIKKDFDIFGIFTCAFLTALGGGTIREIILGHVPFYFFDLRYVLMVVAGILFSVVMFRQFEKINTQMLMLDGVGLVVFALIGASKAFDARLGLFGVVFFATITAIGGGVIRDMVMNETPEIMHRDFYASVAIILGLVFWLGRGFAENLFFIVFLMALCLFIRFIAIYKKINLWKPRGICFFISCK